MSCNQSKDSKEENQAARHYKGAWNGRPSSGRPVAKPREKEKQQDEIKKLKERIVLLECNLDPVKIMKELDFSEETLVNMLSEENLRLRLELSKYRSGDPKISTQSADEIKKKIEEITELRQHLTTAESEISNVRREKDNLEKKGREQNQEYEIEIMRIKKENKNIIDENEKTINKLRKELDEAKHSVKKNAGAIGLQDKLKNAQDEVDELKNRLRKLVGANIKSANPNVTDLSDENRPTKLSEKFSELFNNDWTDAYEEAENEFKTEDKRINHLYKTLLDVSEFCKIKTAEYVNGIRFSVTTLPNSSSASPNSVEIGVTSKRLLEEVGRSFAPKLVDMVFQSYSHEKKLNFTRKENTEKFIRKCVEICWLMNSQDTPVILDTTVVNGKPFDFGKYQLYKNYGKIIDYVVWPPVLLHLDGPVLCKGFAHGK